MPEKKKCYNQEAEKNVNKQGFVGFPSLSDHTLLVQSYFCIANHALLNLRIKMDIHPRFWVLILKASLSCKTMTK